MVKLVNDIYVTRLGWRVTLWPDLAIHEPVREDAQQARASGIGADAAAAVPGLCLMRSLMWQAASQLDLADSDLPAACRTGLAHGPLLALQYALDGAPWAAAAGGGGAPAAAARALAGDLLPLLRRAAAAALPPLARQDQNVGAGDVDADEVDGGGGDAEDYGDDAEEQGADDGEAGGASGGGALGPVPQVVNTACWMTLKGVACVTAALVAGARLPSGTGGCGADEGAAEGGGGGSGGGEPLLSAAQLEGAGAVLLDLLLQLKHNGAVDKVQAGFCALAGRLLRAEDPRLARLPGAWLRRCLEHMGRPGERRGGAGRAGGCCHCGGTGLMGLDCGLWLSCCARSACPGHYHPSAARERGVQNSYLCRQLLIAHPLISL
jgi:hypothetical protein